MALPAPKAFWPVTIAAAVNDRIDCREGGVDYVATIAAATYYSVADLLSAVQAALNAAVAASWTVTVSAQGRVSVASGSATSSLLFASGANAGDGVREMLGFDAADVAASSGATATGVRQHANAWYAVDPVNDDTGNLPTYERAQTVSLFGVVRGVQFSTRYLRTITLSHLPQWKVFKDLEGSHGNEAIERLFDSGWARFRYWPDATVEAAYVDYALDADTAKALPRQRLSPGAALYSLTLKMRKYV
jgi:hypothetical protein